MNNDKKSKRSFSGGFFLFLLAAILVILTLQNLSSDKRGKVSFTHQTEHLVNLDLIKKDESRKLALNDNLVTFSGKFNEELSDDAKARFHYLELLGRNHELAEDKKRLATDLSLLQQNVYDSTDVFLHLSGLPIPKGGYKVIDSSFDMPYRENAVIVDSLTPKDTLNLPEINHFYENAIASPTEKNTQIVGDTLLGLIQNFRSPALGIGDESLKIDLKTLEEDVEKVFKSSFTPQEKLGVYQKGIRQLHEIVGELNQEKNHIRLIQLRSVRNYLEDIDRYQYLNQELDKNESALDKARQMVAETIWFFNNKELSTKALEKQDPEEFKHWFAGAKQEWENFAFNKGFRFKAPDQPRNAVLEKTFKSEEPSPNYFSYVLTILPVVLIIMLLYFVFSRQVKGVGNTALNFGKSPAKMLNKSLTKVTFKDVAGVDEAKEELQEIVEFLKDPGKFTALGARIPKGVLCIGPPGTGKTLIAKAVAGEADRPFFSISGSDFVEMFVGVGASRIRDLFDQAKKHAPCIIFIDEIDAVGRHRGAGIGGGHDEREQTLNQLLVEMDGFDTNEGVILMAATNRPDVLDKALLRPGRFDRRIVLDLPDIRGRYDILKVHARKIKLDNTVELMIVARSTPGASGADLMNILNEAALLAARKGRSAVTMQEVLEATDKVRYGKERRSLEVDATEKLTTAYHEAGHAIVGLVVKHADPVEKVTIIPRGLSLGATHFVPKKNRLSYWKRELLDRLAVAMGGRVAEEIFIHDISSGAQMDFAQATKLARSMVCEWGMTDALGTVAYDEHFNDPGQYYLPGSHERTYSEETAKHIDEEVRKILEDAYKRAKEILTTEKEKVKLMAEMLIEFETLDREDVLEIIEDKWDIEKKRQRVKVQNELHRKLPVSSKEEEDRPPSAPDIDPRPQQI